VITFLEFSCKLFCHQRSAHLNQLAQISYIFGILPASIVRVLSLYWY